MYPLLAPLIWLFIIVITGGVVVVDKFAIYQNTVINKTHSWPFATSSFIIVLMTALAYNTIVVLFESIARRAVIQSMAGGIITTSLIITIWLSLIGMARRFNAKFV